MAGNFVATASCSLSASTQRTVLQLVAYTGVTVKVHGFSVSFYGEEADGVRVQIIQQDSNGSPSSAESNTRLNTTSSFPTTVANGSFATEPDTNNILQYKYLKGAYEKIFPSGLEIFLQPDQRLGIVCFTTSSTVVVAAEFTYEEI